jgi:hypothetical protein
MTLKPKHPVERKESAPQEAPLRQRPFNFLQSRSITLALKRLQSGKDSVSFSVIHRCARELK